MSSNQSEIYEMGYEKWEGERKRSMPAIFLIAQASLRNLVTSSGCFGRFLFNTFYILYFSSLIIVTLVHFQAERLKDYWLFGLFAEASAQLGITEAEYHAYWILYNALFYTCFACLFYGSQLISKDKRANAMQVYFSKAITRTDYFLGKFLAIGMLTATVTLVPSAVILIMGLFLNTNFTEFLQNSWYIPLLTGGYWLILTLVLGSLTLMFSSFFDKSYMAGISIIGFLVFFMVFSVITAQVLGAGDMMGGTNWIGSLLDVGTVIYELEVNDWPKLIWQLIDMTLLVAVSTFLILRNIRPVEVVS